MPGRHIEADLSTRVAIPALLAVCALGAALRIFHLDSGLWYDEIVTLIRSVRPPLIDVLTQFAGNNDHPLYSLLAHLSISGFGESPWSLRLPAAVFGIASIPMLYAFGTLVTSRLEALAAAGLMTVSYHHVWFSQNARGYTALLFFTLLSSYLLLVGLRDNRRPAFVAYGVATALGIYTHLTMVFMVAGHGLYAACRTLHFEAGGLRLRNWKLPLLGLVLVGVLTLIFYAPLFAEVVNFFENRVPVKKVATAGWAFLAALRGLDAGFAAAWSAVLGGVLILVGCWSYLRQSSVLMVLFLAPAPIILLAAAVLGRPIFPRFFFFQMGFAMLIAVRGGVVSGQWLAGFLPISWAALRPALTLPAGLIGIMLVMSALALPAGYRFPKQSYDQALNYLEAAVGLGDEVLLVGAGTRVPFQEYYGKLWPALDSAAQLAAARDSHDSVWVLYTFRHYIESAQPELLDAILTQCPLAAEFPATLSAGEIAVHKCPGASAP